MKKTKINQLKSMLDKFQRTSTTDRVVAEWNDDGTVFFHKDWERIEYSAEMAGSTAKKLFNLWLENGEQVLSFSDIGEWEWIYGGTPKFNKYRRYRIAVYNIYDEYRCCEKTCLNVERLGFIPGWIKEGAQYPRRADRI